jgi:foldase protein PrsA
MLHRKRASVRRAWILALAAVLLAVLLAGCGKKNETGFPGAGKGDVIATYKGGEVTQGEFDKYTAFMEVSDPQTAMYLQIPQYKEQFLRQFALYKVLASRVTDEQSKAADAEVKTFETQINDGIKKDATLQKTITEKNLTVDEMKRIVKLLASGSQIAKAKEAEYTKAVTETEIKTEFDKNAADYNVVSVRHVLIATTDANSGQQLKTDEEALKLAKEVKDKLDKGGDWKAIAKQYSDDTGSKENGGLYEKKEAKEWVAEFKNAANTQEIGKVGEPVQSQFGYHVMKVESREATPWEKLSQANKDELKNNAVGTKVQNYLQDEEKALNIKVTLPQPSASASGAPAATPSGPAPSSASASPTASASPSASASAK